MIHSIEDIVRELRHAQAMHETAGDRVRDLKATSDRAHSEALEADAELVDAYPELDKWECRVRDLASALIAAEGEPS